MHKCRFCGKIYKRVKAYNNHILLCQMPIEDMTREIIPSQREMWHLIKKLIKQNNNQQKKIETLERVVNRDVKKINMVDWLNNNIKLSTNLDKWLEEELIVTIEDMFYIFKTDYTRGVHRILSNSIQKDTAPFKAFSHKSKQLYIYNQEKWDKASTDNITKIFHIIQCKIIRENCKWEKDLPESIKFNPTLAYLTNNQKLLVTSPKPKERCFKYIQNTIIDLIKINLNDMAKFKFYM